MLNRYRLIAIAFALLLGSMFGWWMIASSAAKDEIAAVAARLAEEGWRVDPGETSISGAPLRINYNFVRPSIAAADESWRWSAAEAHIRRLLYRRNVYQFGAPGAHRLETPVGALDMTLTTAAASLRFSDDDHGDDLASRLSVVLSGLAAQNGAADRLEAHLGLTDPVDPALRKLFVKAKDLTVGGAAPIELTLRGETRFAAPFSRMTRGALEPVRIELQSEKVGRPGLLLRFTDAAGVEATLEMTARLSRDPGDDALLGWRGEASFATDDGPAVIAQLGAMGLLDAASQAALTARLADSGRLAGVLKLSGEQVDALDLAPEPIRLRAR